MAAPITAQDLRHKMQERLRTEPVDNVRAAVRIVFDQIEAMRERGHRYTKIAEWLIQDLGLDLGTENTSPSKMLAVMVAQERAKQQRGKGAAPAKIRKHERAADAVKAFRHDAKGDGKELM